MVNTKLVTNTQAPGNTIPEPFVLHPMFQDVLLWIVLFLVVPAVFLTVEWGAFIVFADYLSHPVIGRILGFSIFLLPAYYMIAILFWFISHWKNNGFLKRGICFLISLFHKGGQAV